jgi:alpha-amylase
MSRGIVLYLHVHQPWRIKPYTIFQTGNDHNYYNASEGDVDNGYIMRKVAEKSYRPMNKLLLELLQVHPQFKVSLSITGTFIEQAREFTPDVLESFKALVDTGRVEIVGETYQHSLAFFYSRKEFERQVQAHADLIKETFGVTPTVFRNTELAYSNELARWADDAGYKGILCEGWDPILDWRSPNYLYKPSGTQSISLLMKNYLLSDDVAFRFSNKQWESYPLSTQTYVEWLNASLGNDGKLVNLFMDYETFGEHQWEDSGIFDFMRHLPAEWLKNETNTFYTTTEAIDANEPADEIDVPGVITWADTERDLTAWLGNAMQQEALKYLYALEDDILRCGDDGLINDWRRLQTSDHVYYMCTKWSRDGDVHAYFSPYDSPYDAFLYFMNALRDVRYRLSAHSQRHFNLNTNPEPTDV